MENAWTIEIDRLRAENARLAAELDTCRARCDSMATWMKAIINDLLREYLEREEGRE